MFVFSNTVDNTGASTLETKKSLQQVQIGLYIHRYIENNKLQVKIPFLHINIYFLRQPNEWFAKNLKKILKERKGCVAHNITSLS